VIISTTKLFYPTYQVDDPGWYATDKCQFEG